MERRGDKTRGKGKWKGRLWMLKEGGEEETKGCMLYYLSPADVSLHYLSSWAVSPLAGNKLHSWCGG